jgi:hypothetical protein
MPRATNRTSLLPPLLWAAMLVGLAVCVCNPAPAADPAPMWKSLFDGKSLSGWKKSGFGGDGDVEVKDGRIILSAGSPLTGLTCTADIPKTNYEISLEAMRVNGSDFFCGLTFPVGESPCSFIVGGWGGGVVGLSSIDGSDASENETTQYQEFESGRWYLIRVRVTNDKIQAWIDKTKMADVDLKDKKISIRIEVEVSRPLGIASFATTAALRNIRIRTLSPAELN